MYAEFFGLRELPFNNTPDPRFFYSTPDHEEALASLIYAVKQRKGFLLLTGEVGAGKTLVTRLMFRHFGPALAFANINHAIQSREDLMESVCTEFELAVVPGMSHAQMVRQLHDFLLAKFAQNTPVVLILDEAQNIPTAAFEELRMIGNLEADDAKLLQIAIVGQPELQRVFQSPELRQLKQRLFRSFHLPALDRKQTEGYIRYRLSVAAASNPGLFTAPAIDRIYEVSRGLPRIINTICDNAMLAAYSADQHEIDRKLIEPIIAQMSMKVDDAPLQNPPRTSGMMSNERRAIVPVSSKSEGRAPRDHEIPRPLEHRALAAVDSAQASIIEMKRRLAELEAHSVASSPVAARTMEAEDRLKTMLHNAEVIGARAEKAVGELDRRTARGGELVNVIRSAGSELQSLLVKLQGAAATAKRDIQAAGDVHERLTAATEHALRISSATSNRAEDAPREKISQNLDAGAHAGNMRRPVERRAVRRESILSTQDSEFDAELIERLLSGAQQSLAGLRMMTARSSAAGSAPCSS